MRRRCFRFNFPSMMHAPLRRAMVFCPVVLWACAHEMTELPEQLGAGDAPVTNSGGSSAGTSSGPTAGKSNGSAGVSATGGVAGAPGKPGASGSGGSGTTVVLPPSEGGAGGEDAGGEDGGFAGRGGGVAVGGKGAAGSPANGGAGVGGMSGSGGVSGGTGNGGSTTSGTCDGVSAWTAKTYKGGDRVQAAGKLYECRPYPYEGWCGLSAYQPVQGTYWAEAWTLVGGC